MTPLGDIIARRIRAEGPMSISEYMALCLTHPEHGYYMARNAIGRAGDFVTAPEISQMFGELLGLALGQYWLDLGRPTGVSLVEAGPGHGTLMADILRATARIPGFHQAVRPVLIEASPAMRALQRENLSGYDVHWVSALQDVADGPVLFVANEFFDALPVRQFIRHEKGWAERSVGLDEDGALGFGLAPPAPIAALDPLLDQTSPGDLVQTSAAQSAFMQGLAAHIAQFGGAALIVDYGDTDLREDTFQAVRAHGFADPLAEPGLADLTAHVDFGALVADLPAGVTVQGPVAQGVFLERLGITQRARQLAAELQGDALETHIAAHRRLTHPDEMGTLFKALTVTQFSMPPFPGMRDDP